MILIPFNAGLLCNQLNPMLMTNLLQCLFPPYKNPLYRLRMPNANPPPPPQPPVSLPSYPGSDSTAMKIYHGQPHTKHMRH